MCMPLSRVWRVHVIVDVVTMLSLAATVVIYYAMVISISIVTCFIITCFIVTLNFQSLDFVYHLFDTTTI